MDDTKPSDEPATNPAAQPDDTPAQGTQPAASAADYTSAADREPAPQDNPPAGQTDYNDPSGEDLPQADDGYSPFDPESPMHGPRRPAPGPISWTASEFITHDKSLGWYAGLAGAAVVLAAIVYLLTKDKISTGAVIVAAIALGIYGARKPQQLQYVLDSHSISIGPKRHLLNTFRSFAVIDEGAFSSIAFRPHKRFGQMVTIYFDPKDEEAITDLLSDQLPLEEHRRDVVDGFMKKIRF